MPFPDTNSNVYDDSNYNRETFQPENEVPEHNRSGSRGIDLHQESRNDDYNDDTLVPNISDPSDIVDFVEGFYNGVSNEPPAAGGTVSGGMGSKLRGFDRMFEIMRECTPSISVQYDFGMHTTTIEDDGRKRVDSVVVASSGPNGKRETKRSTTYEIPVTNADPITNGEDVHQSRRNDGILSDNPPGDDFASQFHIDNDPVVIEELDDADTTRFSPPEIGDSGLEPSGKEPQTGGWFQNKMREWRNSG